MRNVLMREVCKDVVLMVIGSNVLTALALAPSDQAAHLALAAAMVMLTSAIFTLLTIMAREMSILWETMPILTGET